MNLCQGAQEKGKGYTKEGKLMMTLQPDGRIPANCPKCGGKWEFNGDEKEGYRHFGVICQRCGFQMESGPIKVSENENLEEE